MTTEWNPNGIWNVDVKKIHFCFFNIFFKYNEIKKIDINFLDFE